MEIITSTDKNTAMLQQVTETLLTIEQQVAECEDILQQGITIDLAPIQKQVEMACQQLTHLPDQDKRQALDDVERLLQRFDRLAETLTQQQDQIKSQLKSSTDNRKATKAYLNASKKPT